MMETCGICLWMYCPLASDIPACANLRDDFRRVCETDDTKDDDHYVPGISVCGVSRCCGCNWRPGSYGASGATAGRRGVPAAWRVAECAGSAEGGQGRAHRLPGGSITEQPGGGRRLLPGSSRSIRRRMSPRSTRRSAAPVRTSAYTGCNTTSCSSSHICCS